MWQSSLVKVSGNQKLNRSYAVGEVMGEFGRAMPAQTPPLPPSTAYVLLNIADLFTQDEAGNCLASGMIRYNSSWDDHLRFLEIVEWRAEICGW